jgi:hypothetical protein
MRAGHGIAGSSMAQSVDIPPVSIFLAICHYQAFFGLA